jgi:hypothetical protein
MFREWILSHNRSEVDSYTNLKLAIGILGMALPLICIFGGLIFAGLAVQNSVSHYYHTNMRDVFVGLLACASILFMTYSGYGIIDNVVTWLIGLAGAGVVIFPCPTYPQMPKALVGILQLTQAASGPVHFGFSGAFFFLLAINSIFLFTLSKKKDVGHEKRLRNGIYVGSGVVILASLATLLILSLVAPNYFENSSIALVFEAVMLFTFGVSWLVKGDFPLFRDKRREPKRHSRNTRRG